MNLSATRLALLLFLVLVQGMPYAKGQDLVRSARNLETSALSVWQSAQSRFQQLNYQGRLSDQDLHLYFDLSAFSRSASLLRELTSQVDPRNLRGGVQSLVTQAVELENLFDNTRSFVALFDEWKSVQRDLMSLARAGNVPYAPLGLIAPWDNAIRDRQLPMEPMGRFWWKGRVDGTDYIRLSGNRVAIEHVTSAPIRDDSYDISSALPSWPITVILRRNRGRGRVEIVEQPSARNGFAVVVLIEDKKGGSDTYEFELRWDLSEPATRIPIRP